MMGSVAKLTNMVPSGCLSKRCNRDGCSLQMDGTPTPCLIIDLDCHELEITNKTRCDYLVVFEEDSTTCVVPIEFKGGGIGSVTHVVKQLEDGTKLAERYLSAGGASRFVPVLAHNEGYT